MDSGQLAPSVRMCGLKTQDLYDHRTARVEGSIVLRYDHRTGEALFGQNRGELGGTCTDIRSQESARAGRLAALAL